MTLIDTPPPTTTTTTTTTTLTIRGPLRERYDEDPVSLRGHRRVIALTPAGRLLDDALATELAAEDEITLLCGRYEGFDERILEHFVSDQVSIGRYVLAGGELAAMVVLAHLAVFFELFQKIHSLATDVANRNFRLLGIFVGKLDQLVSDGRRN